MKPHNSSIKCNAGKSPVDKPNARRRYTPPGILAMALIATSASAQDTRSSAVRMGLEEIVVTAQKREESIQVVPISVAVLSGVVIEKAQVADLKSLQGHLPNVQIGSFVNTSHSAVFHIRGMGAIEPDPYAGNTVSVVVDGVPQFFNQASLLDLTDIERIEVLRGPQGTLFGANTTGGVINIITRQPTGEFGGRARVTVGNWNRLDVNAAVDFPIVAGVLSGKVAAMHHGRDGWITNVVNGDDMDSKDVNVIRGYLRYTPGSNFDATFSTEYTRSRNGGPAPINGGSPGELRYRDPGTTPNPGFGGHYPTPCPAILDRCTAPDDYFSGSTVPDKSDLDSYALNLSMNWDLGGVTLTSITGYKEFELEEYTDSDGSAWYINQTERGTDAWQFTQELRSDFSPVDNVDIIAGGYMMINNYKQFQNHLMEGFIPGRREFSTQDQDNKSFSAFLQSYFQVTSRLQLQAGIRYTYERTKMDAYVSRFSNILEDGSVGEAIWGGDTFLSDFRGVDSESWNEFGWKLGADFQVKEEVMAYAYYARGFKSGGFVGRIAFIEDIGPYDPETVDTIEIGLKSDWFNRRLRLNVAAFYNWYEDLQLAQIHWFEDENGNFFNGNTIDNAASAKTKGIEVDIIANPIEGLVLDASIAYLDAKYTEYTYFTRATPEPQSAAGLRLQNSPKWMLSTGITYSLPVGEGEVTASGRYRYSASKYLYNLLNSPRSYIQPMHYVDANIDWSPTAEGNWTLGFWVRNLTDNRYISAVLDSVGVSATVQYAPPREYGVSLRYEW